MLTGQAKNAIGYAQFIKGQFNAGKVNRSAVKQSLKDARIIVRISQFQTYQENKGLDIMQLDMRKFEGMTKAAQVKKEVQRQCQQEDPLVTMDIIKEIVKSVCAEIFGQGEGDAHTATEYTEVDTGNLCLPPNGLSEGEYLSKVSEALEEQPDGTIIPVEATPPEADEEHIEAPSKEGLDSLVKASEQMIDKSKNGEPIPFDEQSDRTVNIIEPDYDCSLDDESPASL